MGIKELSHEELEKKQIEYIQNFKRSGIVDGFILEDIARSYGEGYEECQKLLYPEIESLRKKLEIIESVLK